MAVEVDVEAGFISTLRTLSGKVLLYCSDSEVDQVVIKDSSQVPLLMHESTHVLSPVRSIQNNHTLS